MGLLKNAKKGARIIGHRVAGEIKAQGKKWVEDQKKQLAFSRQLHEESNKAFRRERIKQARRQGKARARAREQPLDLMSLILGTPEKKKDQ